MEQSGERDPVIVMMEDSPDTRRFIELSSYGSDLTEAREALDLAIQSQGEDSSLAEAGVFLIGFAVVAYCRMFLPSNVRPRLTEVVEIPPEFRATHDRVKTFRNATIAHSQSDLAVTHPVGVLDPATLDVRDVMAVTVLNPLPWPLVHEFRALIDAVAELLDEVIAPVRATLEAGLREVDRSAMVSNASLPRVLHKNANEFNPRSTRHAYPMSQTLYWSQSPPPAANPNGEV